MSDKNSLQMYRKTIAYKPNNDANDCDGLKVENVIYVSCNNIQRLFVLFCIFGEEIKFV